MDIYFGSHIVVLTNKGYVVHEATSDERVNHLSKLSGASERFHLFSVRNFAEVTSGMFDVSMEECTAIMHVATPINPNYGGEIDIYNPDSKSARELVINCVDGNLNTVQRSVLTSSVAAIAPYTLSHPSKMNQSHAKVARNLV